jgi:RNA polymerase sigma-70 factor (ECF subfamily)
MLRRLPSTLGKDTSNTMSERPEAAPGVAHDFRARLLELIPHLRAFAHTLCGNRDVADDLAQEAIANAWEARASFTPGTNLKAWLFVIQRNAFYSAYRRKWREVDWDEEAMSRTLVTTGAQHASAELQDLKRAMLLLPIEQREGLILVAAGGFSYNEAAEICGCATGTMKSRVSRARRALAEIMLHGLPKSSDRPGTAYASIGRELSKLSAAIRPPHSEPVRAAA